MGYLLLALSTAGTKQLRRLSVEHRFKERKFNVARKLAATLAAT
jgi:hypothetical protein